MSTLQTIQAGDLITNSRADINNNFSALNTDKLETSVLDADTTLSADSDLKIPTQKAVKAYVDANGNSDTVLALAGGGDFGTPSATNKFVTEEAISNPAYKAPQVVTFTASGTWTKDPGLKYIIVEAVGGGAGGSGDETAASPGIGKGGSAGGYCKKTILASALGATETVTIGAGGTAGVSGTTPTAGGAGGNTTFGSHFTAGGAPANSLIKTNIQDGGSATGGDINIKGQANGMSLVVTSISICRGADSVLGVGGVMNNTTEGSGIIPQGYGAGGVGAYEWTSAGFNQASAGAPGIVIVTEYYS